MTKYRIFKKQEALEPDKYCIELLNRFLFFKWWSPIRELAWDAFGDYWNQVKYFNNKEEALVYAKEYCKELKFELIKEGVIYEI